MKPCPHCGSSEIVDHYVYMQCSKCLMCGPMMNRGLNDDHADYIDNEHAIEAWNSLPRKKNTKTSKT